MSRKRIRGSSVTTPLPVTKKAKSEGLEDARRSSSEPNSIKLYAWIFEEHAELEFTTTSAVALSEDLMAWTATTRKGSQTYSSLSSITIMRPQMGLHREKSHMTKLMEPYNSGNYGFLVDRSGGRSYAVMEFTLVNKKPKKGAFATVSTHTISFEDDSEQYWSGVPHRLHRQGYRWVTAIQVEHELKVLRMVQRLLRARIPSLDDSDRDSADDENFANGLTTIRILITERRRTSNPALSRCMLGLTKTVRRAKAFGFSAVVPRDLDKLKVWKPKDKEDVDGLPELLDLDLAEYEFIEDDVEGRSRDIAELFQPFIENEKRFWLRTDGKPDFALLEVTVSKNQPEDNPCAAGDIASAYYHRSRRSTFHFKAKDTDQEHYLQKQDFCFITYVQEDGTEAC